jgi:ABC-type multidrug transport system ATPase subunit
MELKIQELSKTYPGGIQALRAVSLNISSGMFGLLGPNGAGKSTLMRTIATLQNADEGTVHLDGIDALEEKDRVRRILGYLPQEFGLYPEMTAEQMMNHIALLKGIGGHRQRKEAVLRILDRTNLSDARKRKLGGFSGGMKQRFGIAQALIADPKLIIVDEPTAGLDPEERNRFHNILSEISEDRIVILSTHIVDDVQVLCNQMAIIHEGKIRLTGKPKNTIKALEGKIWSRIIDKQESADFDNLYNVIRSYLTGGKIEIHVLSPDRPSMDFHPLQPDLEDVYFSIIKNREGPVSAG